jgi:hypothetical protein
MRELVLTPKFKRAFRKFVKRDSQLETKIIQKYLYFIIPGTAVILNFRFNSQSP